MKLSINTSSGVMYADNIRFCFAEAGNGCSSIPIGRYEVTTQFAHSLGEDLPNADGLGWIGHLDGCAIKLGQVRGRHTLVQCGSTTQRLIGMLERCEDVGTPVILTVHE